jgi:hypothetical protein
MRLVRLEPTLHRFNGGGELEKVESSILDSRDAAIAHLLPLVPPAVESPAKPARSRKKVRSS